MERCYRISFSFPSLSIWAGFFEVAYNFRALQWSSSGQIPDLHAAPGRSPHSGSPGPSSPDREIESAQPVDRCSSKPVRRRIGILSIDFKLPVMIRHIDAARNKLPTATIDITLELRCRTQDNAGTLFIIVSVIPPQPGTTSR